MLLARLRVSKTLPYVINKRFICDAKDGMIYNTWSKKVRDIVESREDYVTAAPALGFESTFDVYENPQKPLSENSKKTFASASPSNIIPPMYHYMYCLPYHKKMSELAHDGYEDTFSPPAPFSLRMWGGASTKFISPILIGMHLRQKTFIRNTYLKSGRSGPFVLAVIGNEIEGSINGGKYNPILQEDLNFIYRHEKDSSVAEKVEKKPQVHVPTRFMSIELNSAHLFRYSALTFNSHKIHYDRKYASEKENYGGLLVHGPLQATLLANFANSYKHDGMTSFEYRAIAPLVLEGEAIKVTLFASQDKTDKGLWHVWLEGPSGITTMTGKAHFK